MMDLSLGPALQANQILYGTAKCQDPIDLFERLATSFSKKMLTLTKVLAILCKMFFFGCLGD